MKKLVLIMMFMSILIGMTSCVDKVPVDNGGKTVENVVDMNIPANFDWNMSSTVACQISSAKTIRVFVSETIDAEPFATFFVGNDVEPMELAVSTATRKLYVQYETATGKSAKQAVDVASGILTYQVPQDAAKAMAKADEDPYQKESEGVIYIPASGWGTLMFEDQWPGYGDFDFNDITVNYKIQQYIVDEKNNIDAMMIGVRVKAIGGSIPFELFLQTLDIVPSDIANALSAYPPKNTIGTPKLAALDPKKNDIDNLVLRFDGIRDNKNKNGGSAYLNTERGFEISEGEMVEAAYIIYFNRAISAKSLAYDRLDFFIGQHKDDVITREIHCFPYKCVNVDAYAEATKGMVFPHYYMSKDHLVWGINIPANVGHIYEKGNFLKAYPEFATWAQSGGTLAKDWYTKGVKEYIVKK